MVTQHAKDIYSIRIRLVGNPLKNLNCYIVRTPERNLLIDTGFNQKECLEDLQSGLDELELDMERTDIFATHFHADHCGLVSEIATPSTRVYLGEADKTLFDLLYSGDYWTVFENRYLEEGYPARDLALAMENNPAKALASSKPIPFIPVRDGQTLTVGEYTFQCIHTPGHTPGHMCLYEPRGKTMFLGDHVLFDITPNITAWPTLPNSLGHYLQSLSKIQGFAVALPLPAHREHSMDMPSRIAQLQRHHQERLADTLDIVGKFPGSNTYEIASKMAWSIRAKNWEEFPPPQKWFAVGETLSHLNLLLEEGKIARSTREGIASYTLSQ